MPTNQNSIPKPYLRTLSILHLSLFVGMAAFTIFSYYTGDALKTERYPDGDIYLYLVPIMAAAGYFLSNIVHEKLINKIPEKLPLQSKLARYQSATLIKYAIIEAPTFFALFAYLQDSHALYFTIAVTMILYFLTQRPSEEKIKRALRIK